MIMGGVLMAIAAIMIWNPIGWGATAAGIVSAESAAIVGSYASAIQLAGVGMFAAGAAMIITGLFPMPSMNASQKSIYGWAPVTSQEQDKPIPRYFGTHKVYGNIIAGRIEVVDKKQYLWALISLGYGPVKSLRDVKLNDIPIDKLKSVRIQSVLGYLDQASLPGWEDVTVQEVYDQVVTAENTLLRQTRGTSFDKLSVTLYMAALYEQGESQLEKLAVKYRVQVKLETDSDWINITDVATQKELADTLSLRWSLGYNTIDFSQWTGPYGWEGGGGDGATVWNQVKVGSTDPQAHYEGEQETVNNIVCTWRWGEFNAVVTVMEPAKFYAKSTNRISKTWTYPAEGSIPANKKGRYDVLITRITADFESVKKQGKLYLGTIDETTYDELTYPKEALVSVYALATDQLSGSLRFSCILDGNYSEVYDDDTDTWSITWTRNPAWICMHILTGPVFNDTLTAVLRYDGFDRDDLDLDDFLEWAALCDTEVPEVSEQSVVTVGTGSQKYRCLATHIAAARNMPGSAYYENMCCVMTSATTPHNEVSTDVTHIGGYPAYYAFNGSDTEGWAGSLAYAGSASLIYDFGDDEDEDFAAAAYSLTCGPNPPRSWTFDAWDTVSETWVTLDTRTNYSNNWQSDGEGVSTVEFTFSNVQLYSKYRLHITANWPTLSDNTPTQVVRVYEMQIKRNGTTWASYWEAFSGSAVAALWTSGAKYYKGTEKLIEFNGGFDTETSRWEAALQIAAISRAQLHFNGKDVKVIVDKARTRSYMYSDANIKRFHETFVDFTSRATVIEANFTDEDDDYATTQILVPSPSTRRTNKASVPTFGLTRASRVYRAIKLLEIKTRLVNRLIDIDVDCDSIGHELGDVIGIQTSATSWDGSQGLYCVSSTVNTITFDRDVEITAGKTYVIFVKHNATDAIETRVVTGAAGTYRTVTVTSVWTLNPAVDDIIAWGEQDKTIRDFQLMTITPGDDNMATLELSEYFDDFYDVDTDTPGADTTDPVILYRYTKIDSLDVSQETILAPSGPIYVVHCLASPSTGSTLISAFRFYYREQYSTTATSASWVQAAQTTEPSCTFTGPTLGKTYEVICVGLDALGVCPPLTDTYGAMDVITITAGADVPNAPGTISGLQILNQLNDNEFTGPDVTISWNEYTLIPNDDEESVYQWILGYNVYVYVDGVQIGETTFTKIPIFTYTYEQNFIDMNGLPSPVLMFAVTAIDQYNQNAAVAQLTVTNPVPDDITGIIAWAGVGGVNFSWNKSTETDLDSYEFRTQVNAGVWTEWAETQTNSVIRNLTADEITDDSTATIAIEVRAKDVFNQISENVATADASCNTVSETLFQFVATTDGAGTLADVYDGDLDSGGITI
jgi:hypothetical protein